MRRLIPIWCVIFAALLWLSTGCGGGNVAGPAGDSDADGAESDVDSDAYDNTDETEVETAGDLTETPEDTTAPDFAGIADVETVGPDSIRVPWSAATDDTSPQSEMVYIVKIAPRTDPTNITETETAPGAVEFVAAGLTAETAYVCRVVARDAAGNIADPDVSLVGYTGSDAASITEGGATAFSAYTTGAAYRGFGYFPAAGGIEIVDFSVYPPVESSLLPVENAVQTATDHASGRLWVAAAGAGVSTYSLADPTAPTEEPELKLTIDVDASTRLAAWGGAVFVASGSFISNFWMRSGLNV